MKVLMVEPGKVPYETEVEGGYKEIQKAIGCDIFQATYPFEDLVAVLCDEEGKLNGSKPNRALYDQDGDMYDILFGKFMVVGLGEENFTDLSPELMEKFKERFKHPESFMQLCGRIVAIKEPISGEKAPGKAQGQEL